MTIKMTVTREHPGDQEREVETEVAVDFTFYKACPGSRDAHGLKMEPDEPPSCEIVRVTPQMVLTKAEQAFAEKLAWAALEDERDKGREYEREA